MSIFDYIEHEASNPSNRGDLSKIITAVNAASIICKDAVKALEDKATMDVLTEWYAEVGGNNGEPIADKNSIMTEDVQLWALQNTDALFAAPVEAMRRKEILTELSERLS